jgi:nicotinamide riboside transporter PnuC
MNCILSAARCVLVVGILARHYNVCCRNWSAVAEGTLQLYFTMMNVVGMFMWSFVGVAAAAVDPYYASDKAVSAAFYASLPCVRGLSSALCLV